MNGRTEPNGHDRGGGDHAEHQLSPTNRQRPPAALLVGGFQGLKLLPEDPQTDDHWLIDVIAHVKAPGPSIAFPSRARPLETRGRGASSLTPSRAATSGYGSSSTIRSDKASR